MTAFIRKQEDYVCQGREALLGDSVSLKEINRIRILSGIYSAVFCNEAVMKMYLEACSDLDCHKINKHHHCSKLKNLAS